MSDFASRVAGEVFTKQDEQSRFAAQVAGEAANRKTSGLKTLRGGATGKRFHLGPCMAKTSYSTVRHGWADAIQAGAGEVVASIYAGSPDSFATWIVGPVAEITAHLRTRGNGEEERAKYARLAEEIEAANGNTETPAALLAHVLGLSSERIAEACAVAGLKLERK